MPKRPCPFGDSSPVQLKTRVRLRELSQGVLGERYRREVFEKTKQLLFRGAQAYMDNNTWNGSVAGGESPELLPGRPEACSRLSCSGQMLIGQDGKLLQPCTRETALLECVSAACSSCIRTVDVKETCSQCDRHLCQNCSKLCSCCHVIACALCSVTGSDDIGERILCNGCSMFED